MPHYLNIWFTLGGFAVLALWLGILNDWTAKRVKDLQRLENMLERRLEVDEDFTRKMSVDVHNRVNAIENRIEAIENPPMLKDERESRKCPECQEEKEIRTDDYLCDDCREPENIAA